MTKATVFKLHVQPFSMVLDKADMPSDDDLYDTRTKLDNMFAALTNGVTYLGSSGLTTSYSVTNDDMTINSVVQAIARVNMILPNNISVLTEFYS